MRFLSWLKSGRQKVRRVEKMVSLVVATTSDPASIGPASALLAMSSDWCPGPKLQDISTFLNGRVRLLKQDRGIVEEDNLDKRWEELTGEIVDEIIFLSKHVAVSNRPAVTVHPIGVPHLQSQEECTAGGKPGWAGPPCPRIGPWLRFMKTIVEAHNLTPEFEVTLEATHHGPVVSKPAMFVEIGSTEEYWKRQDAAQVIALLKCPRPYMDLKSIPSSFFQSITSAHCLFFNTNSPFCSSISPALVHSDFSTIVAIRGLRANNFRETDEVVQALDEGNAVACSDVDKVCRTITKNCGADQDMESALQACGVQMKTKIVEQVLDRFRFQEKVAFRFFTWAGYQEGYKHEPHLFTEMIDILSCTRYKSKQFSIICDLLFYMKRNRRDALPMEIFVMVLRTYAEKNLIALRKFAKKKKLRIKSKPEINALNMLLDSLCKCSLVAEAQALYEKLRGRFKPDAQTYTVLFFGWCRVRKPDKAMEIMSVMIERGHAPDTFTCNTVLDAFCKDGQVGEALKLFEYMKTKGCTRSAPTAKTYSIMIVALAQSEKTEEALRLLGEMKNTGCLPDVPTYTDIIEGLCSAGKLEEAYNLLDEMGGTGYPPDIVTYNCFIRVLCNLKKTDEALSLLNRITETGCLPSVHTYNMMIKMFCDVGKLDMAFEIWHGMEKKGCEQDVVSYCTLIKGLFDNGRVQEACSCLLDVIERRMKLPYETFDSFLMELSKVGELRMIQTLSEHMRQFYNHRMARRFSKSQKWRNVKGRRK